MTRTLQPVIEALEATGEINGKLIWSNTGYLINWYLGEMRALLGMSSLPPCASTVSLKTTRRWSG